MEFNDNKDVSDGPVIRLNRELPANTPALKNNHTTVSERHRGHDRESDGREKI